MNVIANIKSQIIDRSVSIAPLAFFRVLFGFMMAFSTVRFLMNGWVYDQFIAPKLFFSYYGFEWVKYPGDTGIYLMFGVVLISSLFVMLGLYYRLSIITFFSCFTYIELIDKTNYLNHYYFISLVAFLMIFLPANRYFSIDVLRKKNLFQTQVPAWTINLIKFQLALVYFYAGIAKLNTDWLLEAMPLKLWLPANSHMPFIGFLFEYEWIAYAFSWFGAIYDLFIVCFLLYKPTRGIAYVFVIAFHVITWLLFPIGMFPWIMILSTLIFFDANFHQIVIERLSSLFHVRRVVTSTKIDFQIPKITRYGLILFCVLQLAMPWRYLLYPGDLFWTEEGYRFSWRVMLMEKAGYTTLHVHDPVTGKKGEVANYEHLTPQQEKMMATQPDMILQYAKWIAQEYKKLGIDQPKVTAESYVTLNGRKSKLMIDPSVDLTTVADSFKHKNWILNTTP